MAADFKQAVTEAAECASRNVAELLVVRSPRELEGPMNLTLGCTRGIGL